MKPPIVVTHASASLPERHPLYAPGLRRRPRANGEARYWLPLQSDIKNGYPLKSLTIPAAATELECAELCRHHWADLTAWRQGHDGPTRYSIAWLIKRYLTDEFSPFQKLRFKTARNYAQDCRIIESTIGQRRLDPDAGKPRITGEDIWRWHKNWGRPDAAGNITAPSRARHVVTMFRILIKYAVAIGVPGAKELADMLAAMEFPTTAAREVFPDFAQVAAIVEQALKQGYVSIAATTLAQFEFCERRISIIGSWEGPQWRPGWTWGNIKEGIIRYTQNKRAVVQREFNLSDTPLLHSLLLKTAEEKRIGPVIICESTSAPWREKHYTDTFRAIARAAGVPDEVCSMDMRAGAATEADEIQGITERHLKDAGGWQSEVYNRYRRNKQRNAQNVVKLRQQARKGGEA